MVRVQGRRQRSIRVFKLKDFLQITVMSESGEGPGNCPLEYTELHIGTVATGGQEAEVES